MATAIDRVVASASIGHNNPPADPFDGFATHIADLLDEAQQHLDGGGVQSEEQAQGIAVLLDMLRTAKRDADAARAAEKKPHDDAAKAVQAKWKPIIDRADLAAGVCKKALAPWLEVQEAEKRAAAEAAKLEAEEKAAAARAALQAAAPTDLAAREEAEALVKEAARAERVANRADKDRAQAKGGSRAVGLRSVRVPELTDPVAALKHYREAQPDLLKAWLVDQAERDVRAGARTIPGFTISETKVAV
jgi:hypothetical protein